MPTNPRYTVKKGSKKTLNATFDVTNLPSGSLSGIRVEWYVRNSKNQASPSILKTSTSASEVQIIDPTAGTVELYLQPDDTKSLTPGPYYWAFRLYSDALSVDEIIPDDTDGDFLLLDSSLLDATLGSTPSTGSPTVILGATQGNPVVLTMGGAGGLYNGYEIYIYGISGMTELNGNTYYVQVLTTTSYALYTDQARTIPVDGTSYTAYDSSGTITNQTVVITNVTQGSPAVATTEAAHGYIQGEEVSFTNVSGMTELNQNSYYAQPLTDTTFSLYVDQNLDIPLDTTVFSAYTSLGSTTDDPTIVITGATQTNPVVLATATAHGLVDGSIVTAGYVGGMTEINNEVFFVDVLTDTTFALYSDQALSASVDGSGYSAYTANGSVTNITTSRTISGISQADPAVVTTSGQHRIEDGTVVTFSDIVGMTDLNNTIYYADALSQTTYALYTDDALTSSVDSSGFGVYTTTDPVIVTTARSHNLTDRSQVIFQNIVGMTQLNDNLYYADVLTDTTFALYSDQVMSASIDGSSFYSYDTGGNVASISRTISNITQSATASVLLTQNHWFTTGDAISIDNVIGMTEVNGNTYYISASSSIILNLYSDADLTTSVDSTGYTAYTSGGTVGSATINIVGATQAEPVVVTTNKDHFLSDQDDVYILGVSGMTQLNSNTYYADVLSSRTIALYEDVDLTTPLNGSAFGVYTSSGRMYPMYPSIISSASVPPSTVTTGAQSGSMKIVTLGSSGTWSQAYDGNSEYTGTYEDTTMGVYVHGTHEPILPPNPGVRIYTIGRTYVQFELPSQPSGVVSASTLQFDVSALSADGGGTVHAVLYDPPTGQLASDTVIEFPAAATAWDDIDGTSLGSASITGTGANSIVFGETAYTLITNALAASKDIAFVLRFENDFDNSATTWTTSDVDFTTHAVGVTIDTSTVELSITYS